MRKINLLVLLSLAASAAAGCEYHQDGFQGVVARPLAYTPGYLPPEDSSEASPDLSQEMKDLKNQLDELQQIVEEQNEITASQEEVPAPHEEEVSTPEEEVATTPAAAAEEEPIIEADPETPEENNKIPPTKPISAPIVGQPMAVHPSKIGRPDEDSPEVLLVFSESAEMLTIVFKKSVDVQSIAANFSIALYATSTGVSTPVKGILTADDPVTDAVKFIASDPLVFQRDSQGKALNTVYTLKIFGADSTDPSRAVKDAEGNVMEHEVSWKLTCVKTPANFSTTEAYCE